MAIQFANKTSLALLPFIVSAVDMNTGGVKKTLAPVKLGDLARLSYVNAQVRAQVVTSAGSAVGKFDFVLKKNGVEFDRVNVSMQAGQTTYDVTELIAVSDVKGNDSLTVDIEVITPAGAGITASFSQCLDVEHPIVLAV